MLSRHADSLYWLSRYVERAESLARILDATQRLANAPTSADKASNEWESCLESAGAADAFFERYDTANEANVTEFLTLSPDNPGSIANCLEIARSNARAVRTSLTVDMWEAINTAWLDLRAYSGRKLQGEEAGRFLEWVKAVSLRFDGSAYRSMLRSESYWFTRLGVYVERADTTARILDVKYHVLLPVTERVGGSLDYMQWAAILRAVSSVTAYHWVYRDSVKPWLVADLLILNPAMPRSLYSCYDGVVRHLELISDAHGRQGPAQRQARAIRTRLATTRIEDIFQSGLHEYIQAFIADNNRLSQSVTTQYLV